MTEDLLTSETPEEKTYFENKGAVEPAKEPAPQPEEKPAQAEEAPAKEPAADEPLDPAEEHPQVAKMVPLPALQEERKLRRQEREERLRLQGRMDILQRMANEGRQAPEPPKELDPLAKLDRADRYIEERQRVDQQTRARQQLVGQYHAAADEFAKETPDFGEAYKHLIKHRIEELTEIGHDPATARQIAEDNETAIVALAFQQGANPAERIYKLAKLRGYAGPKPAEAPKPTASEKLATVESGQKAAKSLSQAAGSSAKVDSIETLLSMDDDEFDKATRGKKWKEIWEPRVR